MEKKHHVVVIRYNKAETAKYKTNEKLIKLIGDMGLQAVCHRNLHNEIMSSERNLLVDCSSGYEADLLIEAIKREDIKVEKLRKKEGIIDEWN